jgi:hypothetical protein
MINSRSPDWFRMYLGQTDKYDCVSPHNMINSRSPNWFRMYLGHTDRYDWASYFILREL